MNRYWFRVKIYNSTTRDMKVVKALVQIDDSNQARELLEDIVEETYPGYCISRVLNHADIELSPDKYFAVIGDNDSMRFTSILPNKFTKGE